MSSWCGAVLSTGTTLPLLYLTVLIFYLFLSL